MTQTKCPTSQSGGGPRRVAVEQVAEQLIGARVRAPQVAGGEVGEQRDRALERGGEHRTGRRASRAVQGPLNGNRARAARRRARSIARTSPRRGRARHGCSPRRTAATAGSRAGPVSPSGRIAGSVQADTTLPAASATASWSTARRRGSVDAGRAQRERAAERPAQVVSLGQLARVERQQRARPGKQRQRHVQRRSRWHAANIRAVSRPHAGIGQPIR